MTYDHRQGPELRDNEAEHGRICDGAWEDMGCRCCDLVWSVSLWSACALELWHTMNCLPLGMFRTLI